MSTNKSKVKAGTIARDLARMPSAGETAQKIADHREAKRTLLTKTTDVIAGDPFCLRNQPIPKAKELFPLEWKMQYSDIYYPYAKDGPLFIDQPRNDFEIALCKRKLEALRKHSPSLRYVYMLSGESENDIRQRLEQP